MFFFKSEDKTIPYFSDPDVRLMLEFQKGSKEAFETLMRKNYPFLLNFIYRYTGDKATAEDLTQEVFIRVYKSASTYVPRAQFKTWLYKIARNTSLNELRRYKYRAVSLNTTIEIDGEQIPRQIEDKKIRRPDEILIHSETVQAVKRAIYALPERQRVVIILRRYEGFSYQEIARTMKISEKAVKSLLSRARENLKNALSCLIHGQK
ncbi:MAG: sigma-70 family RNA polymerase sigma factor [Candidatus Omnitrophica bacterium]|nr:sigma-70 family RNA polymerase sigma factor [Candidatus Omnitrophota bacterium]MBU4149920.1 sigma-70 family RNA polymerase sigma factor [Candidatus Omnitrophota bacterium]